MFAHLAVHLYIAPAIYSQYSILIIKRICFGEFQREQSQRHNHFKERSSRRYQYRRRESRRDNIRVDGIFPFIRGNVRHRHLC